MLCHLHRRCWSSEVPPLVVQCRTNTHGTQLLSLAHRIHLEGACQHVWDCRRCMLCHLHRRCWSSEVPPLVVQCRTNTHGTQLLSLAHRIHLEGFCQHVWD